METKFTFQQKNFTSKAAAKVQYKKAYEAWSIDMIKNHNCTISIKQICQKLNVSISWISTRLCPNVEYVRINSDRLSELGMNPKATVLFNEKELISYLKNTAIFTQQTVVIDISNYIQNSLQSIEIINSSFSLNKKAFGKIPDKLLDKYNIPYDNVNETKRSQYEEVVISSFDFWNISNLSFLKDYPNKETAYRDFFRKGMIKISIFGKVMFAKTYELDKALLPMTIAAKEFYK